ncbi:MAG: DUF489 family protein [Xanthomonadales bacterium]|nr:DUF489 family protein [Xanthomonadales bacterium]
MNAGACLALAGLTQAVGLADTAARSGEVPAEPARDSLATLFVLDPPAVESVFPAPPALGCRLLARLLARPSSEPRVLRLMIAVMAVERSFRRHPGLAERVRAGLLALAPLAAEAGPDEPRVIEALALLYQRTISTLPVRVRVSGDPRQLARPSCVALIRALLFAALRATVLWRQLGGSRLGLVLHRRRILAFCRERLQPPAGDEPGGG